MNRREHFDDGAAGQSYVSHEELRNAISSDYGVPMHQFATTARAEYGKRRGQTILDALSPTRRADYDDYGGPEGYAKRVGGYRDDDQYDPHTPPIEVSKMSEGGKEQLYVGDGHHRALDAINRKVKRIPVEWV